MDDKNMTPEMVAISKEMDRIFYFVCPENLMLKREMMEQVACNFAEKLQIKLYGMRSGPDVEDPKALLHELEMLSPEKFEILYVSKVEEEASVLSHLQKLEFVKRLNVSEVNSGLVAKSIIANTESSEEPEYR